MKTSEILAVVTLIAVVGWVGFMATNANATYSPTNTINTATPNAYNAQGSAPQGAAPSANGGGPAGAQAAPSAAAAPGGAGETVTIAIKASGGYYVPRQITIKQGTKVRLDLDPNSLVGCMVNFNIWGMGGSKLSKYVTAQDHILEFTADTPGVYKTSCNMGMGDGRIIVEAVGANTAGTVPAPTAANNVQLAAPTNPSAAPSGGSCGGSGGGCGCGSR
jgi:plastocyanin